MDVLRELVGLGALPSMPWALVQIVREILRHRREREIIRRMPDDQLRLPGTSNEG